MFSSVARVIAKWLKMHLLMKLLSDNKISLITYNCEDDSILFSIQKMVNK